MSDYNNNKKIIIVCLILIILTIVLYFFVYGNKNKNIINSEDYKYLENYKSNQYIPIFITQEDIAQIYLNNYKNIMLNNSEEAYNLLNKEYREIRFGDVEKYQKYVEDIFSISLSSVSIEKYDVVMKNGKRIYNIYDKSGYQYIFKENSIMNYEVFLDENTVEIK